VNEAGDLRDEFDTVVDMVEDAGCDPNGESSCAPAIRDAAGEGTLLRFPRGTYRIDEFIQIEGYDQFGIVGDGDVTFVPPVGSNFLLFRYNSVGRGLFSGIDIDIRADQTVVGLRFDCEERLEVEDVEYLGRGDHPNREVVYAFGIAVTDPDGLALLRNVRALRGSIIGHYNGGNGRTGIWAGGHHAGTLRVENCRLEEFGNNGMYCSRNPGDVQVVGGVFRNNNVSSIRIGGDGSYVRDAHIEVDLDQYSGPRRGFEEQFNTRGIIVEQNNYQKPAGVNISNCDIRIVKTPRSQAAIDIGEYGRSLSVENTRIRVDPDDTLAVWRKQPSSRPPHDVALRNVTITGSAANNEAVRIVEGNGSVICNCLIQQFGENRDGVRFVNSTDCTVDGGTINVGRYPLLIDVSNGWDRGSCLLHIETPPDLQMTDLSIDSELVRNLLGSDDGDRICINAETVGALNETDTEQIAITEVSEDGLHSRLVLEE
jgi:hypothetical protein